MVADYSNVNPKQQVIYKRPKPIYTNNLTPRSDRPLANAVRGESQGLQAMNFNDDVELLKKYPKAKIPKRYNTLQIHDQHTVENRSNTPEGTERLFDEYERFKNIEGGPRLKITPKYQNGGWIRSIPWSNTSPHLDEVKVVRASLPSTVSRKVIIQAKARPLTK